MPCAEPTQLKEHPDDMGDVELHDGLSARSQQLGCNKKVRACTGNGYLPATPHMS
jgi:hypothetical protein